mgnify:CR=1 FL=1|tara:strand:- start:537 stop:977 length:441 start_codon:yes stop_codon:yes gene_type:complete
MANYSSDRTGSAIPVSTVARKKSWADLNLKLTLHPIRKDIIPLRDDEAIKNSVKNLVLTNFFERPFQPQVGANLRGLLFEPADAITKYELSDGIKQVLIDYEPRIRVNRVGIEDQSDRNAYRITVHFQIIELDSNTEVEIVLQRLR